MYYPRFEKDKRIAGICALSAGVGRKLESFDLSIRKLNEAGFKTIETKGVRLNNIRGGTAKNRAKELMSLVNDDDIYLILCATGGEFLQETLPYIDFRKIISKPKWFMGASDPTSLLYCLTTKYDLATIYGLNAGAFDQNILHKSLENALEIMKGHLVEQTSFDYYEPIDAKGIGDYELTKKVKWINVNNTKHFKGRCIGGCLDALKDILGTPYDGTKAFVDKYCEDGIVWYFDIYDFSSEFVYRTLLQMKSMGYFNSVNGVIVGRVLFSSGTFMTYMEAFKKVFKNVPIIMAADIGHTSPKMTLINGAIINVTMNDNVGKIKFYLE